jgi:quercetin dioxygenase-like cupin family protein
MHVVTLEDLRSFDPAKMRKNNLFQTSRFFCDLYCLEPGQAQAPHTHAGSDKVYVVLEGEGTFRVGAEEAALEAGQAVMAASGEVHGVANEGPGRLVCLVFMAPHPAAPGS